MNKKSPGMSILKSKIRPFNLISPTLSEKSFLHFPTSACLWGQENSPHHVATTYVRGRRYKTFLHKSGAEHLMQNILCKMVVAQLAQQSLHFLQKPLSLRFNSNLVFTVKFSWPSEGPDPHLLLLKSTVTRFGKTLNCLVRYIWKDLVFAKIWTYFCKQLDLPNAVFIVVNGQVLSLLDLYNIWKDNVCNSKLYIWLTLEA